MFGAAIVEVTKPLTEIVLILKDILKVLMDLRTEVKSLKMKM